MFGLVELRERKRLKRKVKLLLFGLKRKIKDVGPTCFLFHFITDVRRKSIEI